MVAPMLRLTQAPNIAIATIWADLLSEAGLAASVQRQYLGAAAGHLPPDQCLPEIWLEHAEHAPQARDLLLRTERPIKQVAQASGFLNEKSFIRAFKTWIGQSPAEFRRQSSPPSLAPRAPAPT